MQSDKNTKQHIYVFGEEVGEQGNREGGTEEKKSSRGDEWRMRHHRHVHVHRGGGMIWGSLLLFAGLMLLLNNFGVVAWAFWSAIVPLWPLLLVLVGLRVIFGHTAAARIIIGLFVLLFVAYVITYGLIRTHSPFARQMPLELRNSVELIPVMQINP